MGVEEQSEYRPSHAGRTRKGPEARGCRVVAAWIVLSVGIGGFSTRAGTPEETVVAGPKQPAAAPAQIEADWLRQDLVRASSPAAGKEVTCEEDAAGGCDGVIDGKWGFHTENEEDPWWRIDLGKPVALDRVVVYNRCDRCSQRNARIRVFASDDAATWRPLYQHDGTVFLGFPDKKPLRIDLDGVKARYVRLGLSGKSYFHLDEVEIYPVGHPENIALGKPATQSSTSTWSAWHGTAPAAGQYDIGQVIERGLKLAAHLGRMGLEVDRPAATLRRMSARADTLGAGAPDAARRGLYLEARWAVRKMSLSNRLLDFDKIVFVKRVPPAFPHMSDQYYGWWSRGGGGIYLLEGITTETPRVRCLTEGWPEGSFLRPDLSFDGERLLFAYAKFYAHMHDVQDKVDKESLPEDAFYQLYEMRVDGSGVRRLTHGKYDDFDARYMPNGDLVFLSTRKGQSIQVGKSSASATASADLPDSYVRCGGGNWRPVPVFTLHAMDSSGKDLRAISAFENFEWTPSVASDGRILYARWDYIDRHNGPYMSLWSTNPDGTNPQLVYGNFTVKPQCVFEARSVPNSRKLVFTAAAHHSNMGGSLVLLDRTRGTEFERPLTRLTPDVCFPETEGWPMHYYANPYPLSETFFLVAWSDVRLPPHTFTTDARNPVNPLGIYLLDAFGNQELLYRDPEIASMYPLALRPRPKPPTYPETAAWEGPQQGKFLLQDVYLGMPGIERGTIKSLRVVGVPPKVQPHMNQPVLGVSREDPGKFVLGTVPVEADGSAYFHCPSGLSVFFQALDTDGLTVQTMRSLTYVQPNQTFSCIGCHEPRDTSPAVESPPLAAGREPSRLVPAPPGSWPLEYEKLVQPVLERHCVRCHGPKGEDARGVAFDLTASHSYENLLAYGQDDLKTLAFEKPASMVGDSPSRKSKLMALLTQGEGHEGVSLDAEARNRLITWMDTYAHRQGHFSDEQAAQLRHLRNLWSHVIATD